MIPAELAARITAASAVLADYRRDEPAVTGGGWAIWAGRLAASLGSVLDGLDGGGRD